MSATAATPDQSSFLFGSNATFIAELYARYLKDPQSVDSSWNSFFTELNDDAREVLDELRGASWAPNTTSVIGEEPAAKAQRRRRTGGAKANGHAAPNGAAAPAAAAALDQDQLRAATLDSLRALMLIRVYRVRGHLQATLDPLGLEKREHASGTRPALLRLHRCRFRPPDLHQQRARHGDGDAPPDPRSVAEDLLRHHRRRVHAHPGPGPEGLDPGAHRRRPQPHRLHRQRQEGDPRAPDRRRELRAFPRQANIPAPSASAWTAARP